jgi:biopolymer transport protein ExbD/biopolymer transport protein TolR
MARLGGLSRPRRGRPLNAEVNIINLVDVMLVLLIIFMVTAPIFQGGIQVELPKVAAPPVTGENQVVITVEKNGQVSIGEKSFSAQGFALQLPILVATKHPGGVVIQGDAAAPYGTVLRVLDQVRRAGLTTASLATSPPATP